LKNEKYRLFAGMDTVIMTLDPFQYIRAYQFCGLYRFLAKVNGVLKCQPFTNKSLINLGFASNLFNWRSKDWSNTDIYKKLNQYNSNFDQGDVITLQSGEIVVAC